MVLVVRVVLVEEEVRNETVDPGQCFVNCGDSSDENVQVNQRDLVQCLPCQMHVFNYVNAPFRNTDCAVLAIVYLEAKPGNYECALDNFLE